MVVCVIGVLWLKEVGFFGLGVVCGFVVCWLGFFLGVVDNVWMFLFFVSFDLVICFLLCLLVLEISIDILLVVVGLGVFGWLVCFYIGLGGV